MVHCLSVSAGETEGLHLTRSVGKLYTGRCARSVASSVDSLCFFPDAGVLFPYRVGIPYTLLALVVLLDQRRGIEAEVFRVHLDETARVGRGRDRAEIVALEPLENLDLDAGGANHSESLTTPSINTTGYHAITLAYTRKTDDTNAPPQVVGAQTLTVEYSVNGGSSWTTLETVTGESPQTPKTFVLSPSADNRPSIKVRFSFVGANSTNHAYIDNVVVTGVSP